MDSPPGIERETSVTIASLGNSATALHTRHDGRMSSCIPPFRSTAAAKTAVTEPLCSALQCPIKIRSFCRISSPHRNSDSPPPPKTWFFKGGSPWELRGGAEIRAPSVLSFEKLVTLGYYSRQIRYALFAVHEKKRRDERIWPVWNDVTVRFKACCLTTTTDSEHGSVLFESCCCNGDPGKTCRDFDDVSGSVYLLLCTFDPALESRRERDKRLWLWRDDWSACLIYGVWWWFFS